MTSSKIWKKEKSESLISQEITTSQEATALWILKNYEDKWKESTEGTKYTGSTRGNKNFRGWSDQGIEEYNHISEHVIQNRLSGKMFEEQFRDEQVKKKAEANRPNWNHRRDITHIVIPTTYNDLEDDNDENYDPALDNLSIGSPYVTNQRTGYQQSTPSTSTPASNLATPRMLATLSSLESPPLFSVICSPTGPFQV